MAEYAIAHNALYWLPAIIQIKILREYAIKDDDD